MSEQIVFYLSAASLLVLANAFFVCAEFALVRMRQPRIQELLKNGNRRAVHVKAALDHLDDHLSSVQVGITLASLGLGWIGERAFGDPLRDALLALGVKLDSPLVASITAGGLVIVVAFFIVTFLHVVVGELMPKTLAIQHTEKLAFAVAGPMRFFNWLFRPAVVVLNGSSRRLLRLCGVKEAPVHSHVYTEEELQLIVEESRKAGVFTQDEQEMLERVLKFHDKTVREIMVPRPDVAAVELRTAAQDVVEKVFSGGFSRLPVYDGDLDNIVGVVYAKDLVHALRHPMLVKLADLLHEAHFVPETQNISSLLQQFQRNHVHLAVVVDEFGDTAGLVTLEDAIEEIVGEIQDEYDHEAEEVVRISENAYLCEGKATIAKLQETFEDFEAPEGDFETVGGLVLHLAGKLPKEGETFHHDGFSFRVAKREGRRLRKIAARRLRGGGSGKETEAEAESSAAEEAEPVEQTSEEP